MDPEIWVFSSHLKMLKPFLAWKEANLLLGEVMQVCNPRTIILERYWPCPCLKKPPTKVV
jgi:hypothetical protein